MDGRKRLSGSQYKARADQKKKREEDLLKVTPRINTFFTPKLPRVEEYTEYLNTQLDPVQSTSSGVCGEVSEQHIQISIDNSLQPAVPPQGKGIDGQEGCETEFQGAASNEPKLNAESVIRDVISDDPVDWVINNNTIDQLILKEINQNLDADFSLTKKFCGNSVRYLSKSVLYRTLQNGEKRLRNYLVYSPKSTALFCFPCRLFGGTSKLATEGISDWSNINKLVSRHENSSEHNKCVLTQHQRSSNVRKIDNELRQMVSTEKKYWKSVLERVVAVIKSLASRGLPFRGSTERFGSLRNGNFMMCLELIAQFDPFLAQHIEKYGNPGRGKISYLSSTTMEEFMNLMASTVTSKITEEVKIAKYFSIIVDSTPDISHVDQLSLNIRYVSSHGTPVERFLCFLPNVGHKSESLVNAVTSKLDTYTLDLKFCRGQSYDNASNMSGCYTGLQARICELAPLAGYVPCAAHSLNLVGTCGADNVRAATSFFETLQHLWTFFSASTGRWEIMEKNIEQDETVIKRVNVTRWASRRDACQSLVQSWDGILKALSTIEDNQTEKPNTRCEASGLKRKINSFETQFLAVFWNTLLQRFYKTNKTLQGVDTDLGLVADLFSSLTDFVKSLRQDSKFEHYLKMATDKMEEEYRFETARHRKRTLRPDESAENEVVMSGRQKLKVEVYFPILDCLQSELSKRSAAYKMINERFGFLIKLIELPELEENFIQKATDLQKIYPADLEESFPTECLHFYEFLKTSQQSYLAQENENRRKFGSARRACAFIRSKSLQVVFPNVDIALRMFLSMAVTNCAAERSFSVLKRVKSYLRSSLKEERLNALALLTIEAELLLVTEFDGLIEEFAAKKSRRVLINV